ncbi:hypothetical protein ACVKS2_004741, partial [Pseudomonas sp. PvP125]
AEWWGKSPFGYFWGSFPKVTRRKGGTHISHHQKTDMPPKKAPNQTLIKAPAQP